MLEDQIYMNYSQKHNPNIGLEAFRNVIRHVRNGDLVSYLTVSYWKLTIETLELGVKYAQS